MVYVEQSRAVQMQAPLSTVRKLLFSAISTFLMIIVLACACFRWESIGALHSANMTRKSVFL